MIRLLMKTYPFLEFDDSWRRLDLPINTSSSSSPPPFPAKHSAPTEIRLVNRGAGSYSNVDSRSD